jgi:tRNA(Ile)-lysidine synthase
VLVSLGYDCTAAHLHHGQREEADGELFGCRKIASEMGAQFLSGHADVPKIAREMGIGLEEAGRNSRYEFFERSALETGCDLIATAHTIDDNLETVLFHLARGTGMAGLRGIPVRRNNIVRPILCLTKAETLAYCEVHRLKTFHDPANDDLQFSRARIRHRVVPEMEMIGSAVARSVFRMCRILTEEDDFLNGLAAAALERAEDLENRELGFMTKHLEVILDRAIMTDLPPVIFKRGMVLASKVLGSPLESKHLAAIVEGVRNSRTGSVTAPQGRVVIGWTPKQIAIQGREETVPFNETLQYPGITESPSLGWKIDARLDQPLRNEAKRRSLIGQIRLDQIQPPLTFRSLIKGERMQPLGFDGHRKVSDLMAEAGVSELARTRLPIVADKLGALWIPGVCLDARAVARRATGLDRLEPSLPRQVLTLRFQSL